VTVFGRGSRFDAERGTSKRPGYREDSRELGKKDKARQRGNPCSLGGKKRSQPRIRWKEKTTPPASSFIKGESRFLEIRREEGVIEGKKGRRKNVIPSWEEGLEFAAFSGCQKGNVSSY